MTIEEKLKEMILAEFKTVQGFADKAGMKYQTAVSILKRGIDKASVQNIIKLCNTLGISVDELAKGRIIPANADNRLNPLTNLESIIDIAKRNYADYATMTIDNQPITENEFYTLIESLELGVSLVKRTRIK